MNSTFPFRIETAEENPELIHECLPIMCSGWPRFLMEDPATVGIWDILFRYFPQGQFALREIKSGNIMALGLTAWLNWNGTDECLPDEGWHWVLHHARTDLILMNNTLKRSYSDLGEYETESYTSGVLSAVAAVVNPAFRGGGLAVYLINQMKQLARNLGIRRVIAPLRPSKKELYPLTPITRYVSWVREDGLPYDPWIRIHLRLGAHLAGICEHSIQISATLDTWSEWSGLIFPEDGLYILPGGAAPLTVSRVNNCGDYTAGGIWVVHEV